MVEIFLGLNKDGTFLAILVDTLVVMEANKPILVKQGEVGRLLVASYIHTGFNHLFGNLVLLLSCQIHIWNDIYLAIGTYLHVILYIVD